jgi:integrase
MKTLAKKAKCKTRPTIKGTVPPPRRLNRDVRPREYLTPKEVERLVAATKKRGRYFGLRDATMILAAFRHGLGVAELCTLAWDQIDFSQGMVHRAVCRSESRPCNRSAGKRCAPLRALKREDGGGPLRVHNRARCADDSPGLSQVTLTLGGRCKVSFLRASAHAACPNLVERRQGR